MGNTTSNLNQANKKFDNFYEIIDYIATYYILTMDFKSLSKLSEKAYCDKLVVLTTDIIERYFNNMDITYLAQRIKNGVEINDLKNEKLNFKPGHLIEDEPIRRQLLEAALVTLAVASGSGSIEEDRARVETDLALLPRVQLRPLV